MTTATPPPSTAPVLASVPLDHPALTRQVRDWNDSSQIHKAVMSLFRKDLPGPQEQRRATTQILYRVDPLTGQILLQASAPPERTDHGIRTTDLSGVFARLTPGQPVHFRIDINAVRCQARTHHRTPVPDAELLDWITARLEPALTAITVTDAPIAIRRAGSAPLRVAHVKGSAKVLNPHALVNLINNGVGRAKAYGCGLLTVLPASGP